MKNISLIITLILLGVTTIFHLIRLIFIVANVKSRKFKYFSDSPTQLQLCIYYMLVIAICLFSIINLLSKKNSLFHI